MTNSEQQVESVKQKPASRIRKGVSDFLCLAAIAYLCMFVVILGYMWVYAWRQGLYPKAPFPKDSIRGPWSSDFVLNQAFREALTPPTFGFLLALLSCIVKPNKRAGISLLLCIIFLFIWFFHFGLVAD